MKNVLIEDGDIAVREMAESDYPLLLGWLTDDRVLEFYEGRDVRFTPETLAKHYGEPFGYGGFRLIVEYRGIGPAFMLLICAYLRGREGGAESAARPARRKYKSRKGI